MDIICVKCGKRMNMCSRCDTLSPDALLGEVIADIETASEPIQNAIYATGRFTTEQCDELADGILQYIKDAGLFIAKKQGNYFA